MTREEAIENVELMVESLKEEAIEIMDRRSHTTTGTSNGKSI